MWLLFQVAVFFAAMGWLALRHLPESTAVPALATLLVFGLAMFAAGFFARGRVVGISARNAVMLILTVIVFPLAFLWFTFDQFPLLAIALVAVWIALLGVGVGARTLIDRDFKWYERFEYLGAAVMFAWIGYCFWRTLNTDINLVIMILQGAMIAAIAGAILAYPLGIGWTLAEPSAPKEKGTTLR